MALDEAVKTALGKVDLSDTLIVVTADHDHTMTINGYSAKGNKVLDLVKNADGSTQNDADGKAVHYSGIRQRPQPPGPAPHPHQR